MEYDFSPENVKTILLFVKSIRTANFSAASFEIIYGDLCTVIEIIGNINPRRWINFFMSNIFLSKYLVIQIDKRNNQKIREQMTVADNILLRH